MSFKKERLTSCMECGCDLRHQTIEHVTQIGNHRIVDSSAMASVCPECGFENLSIDDLAAYELRAAQFLLNGDLSLVCGAELRDIRKAMGLTQLHMADLLGRDVATLCRYEKNRAEIPREIKLAAAGLVERVAAYGKAALDLNRAVDSNDTGKTNPLKLAV